MKKELTFEERVKGALEDYIFKQVMEATSCWDNKTDPEDYYHKQYDEIKWSLIEDDCDVYKSEFKTKLDRFEWNYDLYGEDGERHPDLVKILEEV